MEPKNDSKQGTDRDINTNDRESSGRQSGSNRDDDTSTSSSRSTGSR